MAPASGATIARTPDDAALFIDRDLSMLRFQERVLEEACDATNPVLERVKFLAIVATNIDDFVMVRGPRLSANPVRRAVVERVVRSLLRRSHAEWQRRLVPALHAAGVHVMSYAGLSTGVREELDGRVMALPGPDVHVLSPRGDNGGPSPEVASLGMNLLVDLETPRGREAAIVRVPDSVSPLLPLSFDKQAPHGARMGPRAYVTLEDVVRSRLATWFPGARVHASYAFRLLRQADEPGPVRHHTSAEDALAAVAARRTNPVVALMIERGAPSALLLMLTGALGVPDAAVFRTGMLTDPRMKWELSRLPLNDLRWPPLARAEGSSVVPDVDPFASIRAGDILLHHPYDAFDPVVRLIQWAAEDPDVLSLAITLYRTDRESPVCHAVLEAIRRGKKVDVVVELNARFDEERNAAWARTFAKAGATVHHAPPGLKVHAKMALIVRQEGGAPRRYAHLSSGNYNAFTSRVYTDVGLLTCRDDVTSDVAHLFAALTDSGERGAFSCLAIAPVSLRQRLEWHVDREIEWVRRGEAGHIVLKMNGLVDRGVIRLLHRAASAGVRVDLLVRGICCLRPGVHGLTDGITVRSIVGRFLEHSRAWYFRDGGREQVYVGSADLMPRNLERRIEVMVPLANDRAAAKVRGMLRLYMSDNMKARELRPDGTYARLEAGHGESRVDAQAVLLGGGSAIRC